LNQSTFNAIAAASSSSSSSSSSSPDASSFTNLTGPFTKVPKLPDHLAPRYESQTAFNHSKITFDPETSIATNTLTGKVTEYKKSDPIVFILANESMPGAFTPAAARLHRFKEAETQEDILFDKQGNAFVICPSHGDITKVEALQTDHADSASSIQQRQCEMVTELNNNLSIAKSFIEQFKLEDLFIEVNGKYQGTLYFYERYYNDIDNLWNICQTRDHIWH
jgi:hypothetical protein